MARTKTKRGKGEGTIRKRTDGRWEGRYIDPITSKPKSVYGKTQKETLELLKEKVESYNIGNIKPSKQMLYKHWLKLWLNTYNCDIKPATMASYIGISKNYITPILGDKHLFELTVHDIQNMYVGLLNGKLTMESNMKNRGDALSPKTIKNIHGVIHKSLNKAKCLGYIKNNIAEDVVLPRSEKPEIKPIEEDSISPFLDAVKEDEYGDIYIITLFTGMREGEILGLEDTQIDFSKGIVYLKKQLQKDKLTGEYHLVSLKNGKTRKLIPPQFVLDLLKQRIKKRDELKYIAGSNWYNKSQEFQNLIFTNDFGRYLIAGTVYKHFKKIVAKMNMPDARVHDLRHSYAVLALQNGDDIKTVQETLGHHSAAFTLDTYAHVTNKMMYESAKRMDRFIQSL